jgi:hypothetical protein
METRFASGTSASTNLQTGSSLRFHTSIMVSDDKTEHMPVMRQPVVQQLREIAAMSTTTTNNNSVFVAVAAVVVVVVTKAFNAFSSFHQC